jgi:hypothetical protein
MPSRGGEEPGQGRGEPLRRRVVAEPVEGQQPSAGNGGGGGERDDLAPDLVLGEARQGKVPQAGVLRATDPVFSTGPAAVRRPEPNQAPTPAGFARPRTTSSDKRGARACSIQTRADAARRNRGAWRAEVGAVDWLSPSASSHAYKRCSVSAKARDWPWFLPLLQMRPASPVSSPPANAEDSPLASPASTTLWPRTPRPSRTLTPSTRPTPSSPFCPPTAGSGAGAHTSSAITARTMRRPCSAIRGKVCR